MNSKRIRWQVCILTNGRTRAEEAIEKILREGKVEQTKTGQKFGINSTRDSSLTNRIHQRCEIWVNVRQSKVNSC